MPEDDFVLSGEIEAAADEAEAHEVVAVAAAASVPEDAEPLPGAAVAEEIFDEPEAELSASPSQPAGARAASSQRMS